MKTLIIGLGNPILGDDGAGWQVVDRLAASLGPHASIEFDCLSLGGLSLMERMLGYRRVILVDTIDTGRSARGSVSVFPLAALTDPLSGHSASIHDASLMTALQAARDMGAEVPARIDVIAIESGRVYEFSERLSPAVAQAVPLAVEKALGLLGAEMA
jgi:hydrogenase maturation protease